MVKEMVIRVEIDPVKGKNRKRNLDEIQDTLLEVGSTVQSLTHENLEIDTGSPRNLLEKKKKRKSKKRKQTLGENLEFCDKNEDIGIAKSEMQDTLLIENITMQSTIQECLKMDMDAAKNLADDSTEQKKISERSLKKRERTLGGKLEYCDNSEVIEIAKSKVQDTLPKVGNTVQSPIQEPLKMDMDTVAEKSTERKKNSRKSKKTNQTLGGNLELCDKREEIEISTSAMQDALLKVDLSMRSPIQECPKIDMDTARDVVEKSTGQKNRRKSKKKKDMLDENLDFCDNREDIEVAKSEKHDSLLKVDLATHPSIQERLKMDMDTTRNLSENVSTLSKSQKTNRRKKLKKKQQRLGENLEFCRDREEIEIARSEMHDSPLKVDLATQSSIQERLKMDMDMTRNLDENVSNLSKSQKKNRRKKLKRKHQRLGENLEFCRDREEIEVAKSEMHDSPLKVDLVTHPSIQERLLMDMDTTRNLGENVSTLSLSDVCMGNSDELNKVKDTDREFGFSAREGSRPNDSNEERSSFGERVQSTKVKPFSDQIQHEHSMPICDAYVKRITEKIEKPEHELEQEVKESSIHGKKVTDKSQNEQEHHSSDVGVTKHDPVAAVDKVESERVPVARFRRKLLILDVNGLLADIIFPPPKECKADINILQRAIFKRPFFDDFLMFCFERFDVGIWSSRSKKVLDRVGDYLLGDLKHKLLFFWDVSHCTGTGFKTLENKHKPIVFKELRKVWEKSDPELPWKKGYYNESNTLLLDDSPYKALLNPMHTAIFPFSYSYKDKSDNSLGPGGDLRVYLEDLATAENVKMYVEQHPFGQRSIDETSSFWDFYSKVLHSVPAQLC